MPLRPTRAVGTMTAVVAVLSALMACLRVATMAPLPIPLGELAKNAATSWLPWCLGAPLIALVGVRFRYGACHWSKLTAAHLVACGLMVGACVVTTTLQKPMIVAGRHVVSVPGSRPGADGMRGGLPSQGPTLPLPMPPEMGTRRETGGSASWLPREPGLSRGPSLRSFLTPIPIYVAFAVIVQALLAFTEIQNRKVSEERLRTELTRSQLAALRTQMNPHFLFNTLNSVSASMSTDVETARSMLADLAALLRFSFREADRHEVSLGTELELVRRYIKIQQVRFGDRLSLCLDAPRELHVAYVPALCIQPLVENSIAHAVERSTEPCEVLVTVRRDGELLRIEVLDDGRGGEPTSSSGIGLDNIRTRLSKMYGSLGTLDAGPLPGRGYRVRITVPHRERPCGEGTLG